MASCSTAVISSLRRAGLERALDVPAHARRVQVRARDVERDADQLDRLRVERARDRRRDRHRDHLLGPRRVEPRERLPVRDSSCRSRACARACAARAGWGTCSFMFMVVVLFIGHAGWGLSSRSGAPARRPRRSCRSASYVRAATTNSAAASRQNSGTTDIANGRSVGVRQRTGEQRPAGETEQVPHQRQERGGRRAQARVDRRRSRRRRSGRRCPPSPVRPRRSARTARGPARRPRTPRT